LAREIGITADALSLRGRGVDTLYLGGGTPSLLETGDLEAILDGVAGAFNLDPAAEISLEANPESVTLEKLRAFRSLGINRLSLGVQSFRRTILETLGRAHSPKEACDALRTARRAGFDNLSLDLMLALPGQDRDALQEDLRAAVDLAPEHLSAYLLEMDKETALRARIEKGELKPPTEDEAAEMYDLTREVMEGAGLEQYEISSFARPGFRCRHNLKYWTDRPFLGCGPSAWSYLDGRRFQVTRDLEGYLEAVRRGNPPDREEDRVTSDVRFAEAVFAGLRLMEGIDLEALGRAHEVADPLVSRLPKLRELEEAGLLLRLGSRIRLTPRALPVANEVFRAFL
jgi:oxygen-independent coproporphyrinogen-3 oxidase